MGLPGLFFRLMCLVLQITQGVSQKTKTHYISRCDTSSSSCDDLRCGGTPKKYSCSCHPACPYFDDCCYDVDDYYQRCTTEMTMPNVSDSLSSFQFNCTKDEVSGSSYWMVSSCPPHWEGQTDSCSGENVTVGTLEDGLTAVPVISNISGVTFSNVFCALCNTESLSDLQPWNIDADCEEDVSHLNLSPAQLVKFVLSNCSNLHFVPAVVNDQLISNYQIPCPAVPAEGLIDTCPGSDGAEQNQPVTDSSSLCADFHAPIYVAGQRFKNIHCAECYLAGINETITLTECLFSLEGFLPDQARRFGGGPVLLPISVVLTGFDQLNTGCSEEEIYDEITSVCRQLYCPSGYELVDNLCTSSVDGDIPDLDETTTSQNGNGADVYIVASFLDGSGAECSMPGFELFFSCLQQLWNVQFNKSQEQCTEEYNSTVFEASITYFSGDILREIWYTNSTELQPKPESCSLLEEIQVTSTGSEFEENSCRTASAWLVDDDDKITLLLQDVNETSTLMIKNTIMFSSNGNVTSRRMYKMSDLGECNLTRTIGLCPTILLDASEFSPMVNASEVLVYIKDPSVKLTPDEYTSRDNGTVEVCSSFVSSDVPTSGGWYNYNGYVVVTAIGSALSISSLVVCLVTYGVFASLRSTISTFLTMILCLNLLIASVSQLLVVVASKVPFLCCLVAWSIHFFYLAVFSTSSLIGAHFVQTFQVKLRSSNAVMTPLSVALNLAICYGIPALISLTLLASSLFADWDVTFGNEYRCLVGNEVVTTWASLVPCGLSVSFNVSAFVYVVAIIFIQTRGRSSLVKNNKYKETFTTFSIFIKILTVLGLTWLFGFFGAVTRQPALIYIFDTLTPFQGFFIFLAFMCRRKTWRLWKQKLTGKVAPEDSSSSKTTKSTTAATKTSEGRPEGRIDKDGKNGECVATEITRVD